MSTSTATMLADLSDEAPAGEDLENDPDFAAMERASERKPETQYGDVITPETPPDWKEVDALATALLDRTRDLRVLVHQAVARLNLDGPPAFAPVLRQIGHLLETRWDIVHPRLDPEDDNDPTLRANTLSRLRDERNVLRPLREMPLARSPQTGVITWRDIAIFRGQVEPEEGREKPNEALIRDAFSRTDRDQLLALRESIDVAAHEVGGIIACFERVAKTDLDLENLAKILNEIQKDLARFEPADEAAVDAASETESSDIEQEPMSGAEVEAVLTNPPAQRGAAAQRPMSVRSITNLSKRDDALYLLELAASYFRTNEPSNPAPLLIDRARRLATMDFLDILRDLAPDGMSQVQLIAGQPPE